MLQLLPTRPTYRYSHRNPSYDLAPLEMGSELPSGWEERTSRSTGQSYFLNQVQEGGSGVSRRESGLCPLELVVS